MQKDKIWETTLHSLEANTTKTSFSTWIMPLSIHHIDEDAGVIYLSWPEDEQLLKHVNDHYKILIENEINKSLEKPCRIIIKQEKEYEPTKIDTSRMKNPLNQEKLFNPRFNFENFIVGSGNKYAHAVSVAVSESPGNLYNPLFIYGGSGLGKTHLMQAIGVQTIRNNPNTKVLYVSTEMFTNELISAIQENKMKSFKKKYRNIDVLLIDDIHFLEGKPQTQEEFFYTFETLYNNSKQIVITSDRPPKELKKLDDRLVSRFSWNMVADIQPPDYETRVAILKNFAEKVNLDVKDKDIYEVLCLIADQIQYNIREIEGAFNRIVGFSNLLGEKITVDTAKSILKDIISDNEKSLAPERIKSVVANYFKIKVSDIDSPKRNAEINIPRQIAMYLCRENTNLSHQKIGKLFGNRHYSTVMHAIEKIENDLKIDNDLKENIKNINLKLNSNKL